MHVSTSAIVTALEFDCRAICRTKASASFKETRPLISSVEDSGKSLSNKASSPPTGLKCKATAGIESMPLT